MLWKKRPSAPGKVLSDTIVPFYAYDALPHCRAIIIDLAFKFDDVLDGAKLQSALSRLLELGEWRKLGARVRQNEGTGKLEYHIPEKYDSNRPGFTFTSVHYDMNIKSHSIASRIPEQTHRLALLGCPSAFEQFLRSPKAPESMEGFLCSDIPPLTIHMTTFQDATLLTISFSHSLTDIMGFASMMEAWVAVLNGNEDQVPSFIGYKDDPYAILDEQPPLKPHLLLNHKLKGFIYFLWVIRFVFDLLWYRKEEDRVIFLPAKRVQQLHQEAKSELEAQNKSDETRFVSESDVVCAWWCKTMLKARNPSPTRTVMIRNVFDFRKILVDLNQFPSTGITLLTNAVYPSVTLLPVRQILEEPVSFLASQIRQSLEQQRTADQIRALKAIESKDGICLFGDSSSPMITCSNWCKARLFDLDFSAAVVSNSVSNHGQKLVRPSYINTTGKHKGYPLRNAGNVIGVDAAGNWWLSYTLRSDVWPKITEAFESENANNNQKIDL